MLETSDEIRLSQSIEKLHTAIERVEKAFAPTLFRRFLFGIATGFGTVIGATFVFSLLILILRPLENLDLTRPIVEAIREAQKGR